MNENHMRREIRTAMDVCLSGVQPDAFLMQHVLKNGNKAVNKRPSRTLAVAAGLALAAAAVAIIVGNMLPIWPDTRNAAQVADTSSASRAPVTTEQQAPLDPERYETVSQPESRADIVGRCFELGGVTFTVLEQYADPYAAKIVLNVSLPDGEAGILCPVNRTGTIFPDVADRLGVSHGITWAQAAKQLDLPLYLVRVMLFDPVNDSAKPGLSRSEENGDGSETFYAAAFLNRGDGSLPQSIRLRLMAAEADTDDLTIQTNPQSRDIVVPLRFEQISETRRYTIPDGQAGSSRFRYNDWDGESLQPVTHEVRMTFTPIAAQADLTPAGVYVKVECRVAEEDIERGLNFGLGAAAQVQILGADGEALPSDRIFAFPMDDTAWPTVTFTGMIEADSIPDVMTFQLLNYANGRREAVLEIELKE